MENRNGCYVEKVRVLYQMYGREIAEELRSRQAHTSEAEYRSWENSIPVLADVIHRAGLDELTLVLEYETPIGSRIDAVLLGNQKDMGKPLALIIELKQWSSIEENTEGWESRVSVQIGGHFEDRPHPIQQTLTYAKHLRENHSGIAGGKMEVRCCQFLHNFKDKSQLFEGNYRPYAKQQHETYTVGDEEKLAAYLSDLFSPMPDQAVVEQFLDGTYVLGKAGFDALRQVFGKKENMVMIDDQIEINKKVCHVLDELQNGSSKKTLIVISGPPGTGKTVVGMHIIYAYCVKFCVTGRNDGKCIFALPRSRTLSEVITGASGISPVYLDKVPFGRDIVVVDEAHRIEDLDVTMENLFDKTQIVVVLQDDRQRIRLTEEGTLENFQRFAQTHNIELMCESLVSQKRAGYLGSYVSDLDRLFYERWDQPIRRESDLELLCWDSLFELDEHLRGLAAAGRHVKWYAPFCWPWSRSVRNMDIVIPQGDGAFQKAWNPINGQYRWYLGKSQQALDQVGCIYTAQGLEFDDTGVIWWKDLFWDEQTRMWRIDLDECCDEVFVKSIVQYYGGSLLGDRPPWRVTHGGVQKDMAAFLKDSHADERAIVELFLNTYRVLLTRAKSSVHIWFCNPVTKEHVRKVLGF